MTRSLAAFALLLVFLLLPACTKKGEGGKAAHAKKECASTLPPLCQPNEEVVMQESYTGCLAPRCKPKTGCAAVYCPEPERCLPGERLVVTPPPAGQCCPSYQCQPAG